MGNSDFQRFIHDDVWIWLSWVWLVFLSLAHRVDLALGFVFVFVQFVSAIYLYSLFLSVFICKHAFSAHTSHSSETFIELMQVWMSWVWCNSLSWIELLWLDWVCIELVKMVKVLNWFWVGIELICCWIGCEFVQIVIVFLSYLVLFWNWFYFVIALVFVHCSLFLCSTCRCVQVFVQFPSVSQPSVVPPQPIAAPP